MDGVKKGTHGAVHTAAHGRRHESLSDGISSQVRHLRVERT